MGGAHLEKNHDLTLAEHCEAFEEVRSVRISAATVGQAIARLQASSLPCPR